MAELILYNDTILISLWFSCGHNTQLSASSIIPMKNILTTTEKGNGDSPY
jgi:hypothetical protein